LISFNDTHQIKIKTPWASWVHSSTHCVQLSMSSDAVCRRPEYNKRFVHHADGIVSALHSTQVQDLVVVLLDLHMGPHITNRELWLAERNCLLEILLFSALGRVVSKSVPVSRSNLCVPQAQSLQTIGKINLIPFRSSFCHVHFKRGKSVVKLDKRVKFYLGKSTPG
jgi:hypothetical protein